MRAQPRRRLPATQFWRRATTEKTKGKTRAVISRAHLPPCYPSLFSGVRPFGVSLLVAGFDDAGPQLFQVDPSGSFFAWKASAIGKNMTNAKTFLDKRWRRWRR